MFHNEYCEGCGCLDACECDEPADGYECGECGYEPTLRELQGDGCPVCAKQRAMDWLAAKHLISDPQYNSGRAFNSGVTDAAANSYRPPIDALVDSYHRGWRAIRPLPEHAS